MNVLSVDPGDTTGWVLWTDDGIELSKGQLLAQEFIDRLAENYWQFNTVVFEDFILYRGRAAAQTGSRFKASQVIGALKMSAKMQKATVVMQPAQSKSFGYKFARLTTAGNHAQSHWRDAYAHGYFYFVKQGILKTQQELDRST